jgi:hypothetical protein
MKFINEAFNTNLSTKNSDIEIFDSNGNLVEGQEEAYAKSINIDVGDNKIQRKFFIRTYNNLPLDPIGSTSRRNIWDRTELKIVSRQAFDHYINYLKTKNALFFTKANRSFIDG